jgi:hypothetical protein
MTHKFPHLPKSKFKEHQYITDGKGQSFEIRFIQYDFEKEEYYYFPIPDTFAGKIYESDAELTEEPKSSAMEVYELLFANKKKTKKTD